MVNKGYRRTGNTKEINVTQMEEITGNKVSQILEAQKVQDFERQEEQFSILCVLERAVFDQWYD